MCSNDDIIGNPASIASPRRSCLQCGSHERRAEHESCTGRQSLATHDIIVMPEERAGVGVRRSCRAGSRDWPPAGHDDPGGERTDATRCRSTRGGDGTGSRPAAAAARRIRPPGQVSVFSCPEGHGTLWRRTSAGSCATAAASVTSTQLKACSRRRPTRSIGRSGPRFARWRAGGTHAPARRACAGPPSPLRGACLRRARDDC